MSWRRFYYWCARSPCVRAPHARTLIILASIHAQPWRTLGCALALRLALPLPERRVGCRSPGVAPNGRKSRHLTQNGASHGRTSESAD
eukprot:3232821-Prymnesium_polylepis.1